MANEINILEHALPPRGALPSPESLPSPAELDQMTLGVTKVRRECRLVSLNDTESAAMEAPLTPKEVQLLERIAALEERFPYLTQVLATKPQFFAALKQTGLALDQLEGGAAELESADQACQVIMLHGITEDVDRVDAALARHPDQSLHRMAFSPMLKVRDLTRIRALAKAERTRSRQQAEQQALASEEQQQAALKRAPRLVLKTKEAP